MASQWFYHRQGNNYGPFSSEQLKSLAATNQISPSDLIWKEGMAEWTPASKSTGLFPHAPVAVAAKSATLVSEPSDDAEPSAESDVSDDVAPQDAPIDDETPVHSTSDSLKAAAAASASFVRSAVQRGRKSLKQSFGDAAKQSTTQAFSALGQLITHPFRLSFVTIVFVLASGSALGSLVGAILFPMFVMGYITCIRSILAGSPMELESFIAFMRHGWDSFWHLLMLLAAFFVTTAAMLAPFFIGLLLLGFLLQTAGAVFSEFSSQPSPTTSEHRIVDDNYPNPRSTYPEARQPSNFSQWVSDVIDHILALGMTVVLMIVGVVVLTPIAAALILFFYLVSEVSAGQSEGTDRFALVYDAFRKMLVVGRSNWKELLTSGLTVSICFVGVVGVVFVLANLLSVVHLYALTAWSFTGLLPAALCVYVVYINVFVTLTCISLGERKAT